ncbi:MAG TPA: aldehyde dehydrogenase family protein [Terriglobales bacterium]|nr:aldehyde dehydrogenase family protein [Terriglobales bacterium]
MPPEAQSAASITEARELIEQAHRAWQDYRAFSQAQVDAIVDAMAAVATANAERLAAMAVEETTYGKVADKVRKNRFASERVYQAIRPMKTVGVLREDLERGIIELGEPVGVVAAILPCTNPTSTAIYKILIALKAGNAIVLSPHPAAMRCICETVGLMQQAARAQGAPEGLIGCFSQPTREGTGELMTHPKTRVILATGGMGIVRAAYSSGKPAFGVGPGNVPAFVDRSAKLEQAIADVVAGKSFDWGTICSSEQALVAEAPLREAILAELRKQQVHLLSKDQAKRLADVLIHPESFTVNAACVGQSPQKLAALAGFGPEVGPEVRVLAAELEGMGKQYPLSAEKLSPVLALYFMPDREAAMRRCSDLLHFGGLGHTCVIHAQDDAVIREYGRRMPAFRVVVNSPAPLGSIGATTNLFPAMTLGCGAVGGNITSDNIGPQHLMNIKRIAYAAPQKAEARPLAAAAAAPASGPACACQHAAAKPAATDPRDAIRDLVETVLAERGIRPASAAPAAPAPPASTPFVPPPLPPKPKPVAFVCEADVREALAKGQKIPIGPKTLLTPSARDLGRERDAFEDADG